MKNLKTVIIIAIVATLVVGGVVAGVLIALNLGHEHVYTAKVIEPTCTKAGYTKYTCECGHTYNADEVAALNHRNTTEYVYPTVDEPGSKTSTCEVCGHVETTVLNAMSVSNPKVSAIIAKFIGAVAYSLEIGEDSAFTFVSDSDNEANRPDSSITLTFDIAEAAISGKGEELAGHLTLEAILTAINGSEKTTDDYAVTIFVNGDDVAIAATHSGDDFFDTEINLTDMLYDAICAYTGLDTDSAVEVYYVLNQVVKCLPIAEGLAGAAVDAIPELSDTCGQAILDVFKLIGEDIIVEDKNSDGSTTYSVDITALEHLLSLVEEDKTVEDYIASVFGENTKDEIISFIETLPDKTVREVSEAIIRIGEATDASMEDLYYAVDIIIYLTTGAEISIEGEIYSRYDMTLAELIAEASDIPEDETAEFVEMIEESFDEVVDVIETTTLKNIINSIIGEYADTDLYFLDNIKDIIEQFADVVSIEVTVGANDEILSIDANLAGGMVSVDFINDDGDYIITLALPEDIEIIVKCIGDSFSVVVKEDGDVVASGAIDVEETVSGSDVTTLITGNIDSDYVGADLELSWTTSEDVLVSANASLVVEDLDYDDIMFEASVDFVNNDGNYSLNLDLPDDVELIVNFSDDSFSIVGLVEGDVIASADAKFEETVNGNKTVTTLTYEFESNYFDVHMMVEQTLIDGVLTGTVVSAVMSDGVTEYYNFFAETVYIDDSVTLDIYTKVNGQVIIDGSVTLSAEETDSKTEYALDLDVDKIFLRNAGESTPGSTRPGAEESWTANYEEYLIIDAIINFVCER